MLKVATVFNCLREIVFDRNIKCVAYLLWKVRKGDETLRIEYPLTVDSVVLDVGGFRGDWAAKILDRYRCRLYIFEPVASHLAVINERFSENRNVEVIAAGVAGQTSQASITLNGEGSSTVLDGGHTENIQLLDVADVFFRYKLDEVELMKINIEGGEYEMLERMYEKGLMVQVRYFQIQFHDFIEGAQEKLSSVRKMLSETHKVKYCYPFVWESWERR